MSEIGELESPRGVMTTRVDPKLFGKPADFLGEKGVNGDTLSGVFRNWFVSSTMQQRNGWTRRQSRLWSWAKLYRRARETDTALYMSLAMVCMDGALDVVKAVTGKRGFECWRRLCKEYGSTTGTSLHEYSNLLEYDFGTTDGFKKKLLKWENQIADFQKVIGETFSDRLKCAIVLSRSPGPIRTYLRVQNRGNYNELRLALMN